MNLWEFSFTNGYEWTNKFEKENTVLKHWIADLSNSFHERVELSLKPLKEQNEGYKAKIKHLEELFNGMCQSLANVTKTFALIKRGNEEGDQVDLSEKQTRLITAIEKYVTKWLRAENKEVMASEVENNIGISKGIEEEIELLTPRKRMDRGRGI